MLALALALALAHLVYVARVGGDFMYGRFLVPITPAFAVIAEGAVAALAVSGRRGPVLGAVALVLLQRLTPSPVSAEPRPDGIVDERAYYATQNRAAEMDADAAVVAPYVVGIPLRVAIYGSEARFVYRVPLDPVVEAVAGLTDAQIAHQPLAIRGVVGHEKHASLAYLIMDRKVDIVFRRSAEAFGIDDYIPLVLVNLGTFTARLVHWDPAVADALRRRGATVPDFPRIVDELIEKLDRMPDAVVVAEYGRIRNFYFAHVVDPEREGRFHDRLRVRRDAR
jgi:hypothetical protein